MNFLIIHIIAMCCVQLATSKPNLKWNKRSKDFEVISEVSRREEEAEKMNIERKKQMTKRNFNGQPLRFAFYEQHGNFESFDNDTKARGIFGEIWTTVCTFLNFTMVLSKQKGSFLSGVAKNGSAVGVLKKIWNNESDVVPRVEMYPRRLEVIEFSTCFWMQGQPKDLFGGSLGTKSDLGAEYIYAKRMDCDCCVFSDFEYREYRGRKNCGSTSERVRSGSYLLNVTIVLFAYLILSAYNSRLIFSLAQESFAAPFTDVNSLMEETNYKILLVKGSRADAIVHNHQTEETFKELKNSPRLKLVKHANDLYSYICKYPDEYVFLDIDEDLAVRGKMECDVEPVGYSYYPAAVASGFRRSFEAKKSINFWLVKFQERGLVDRIKKRYMSPSKKSSAVRQATGLKIGMDHVSVMFAVLCSGMIGSIIICIAENIIFRM